MTSDQIAETMRAADYSMGAMQIEHQAFLLACRFGRWEEAEVHRLAACASLEVQMDAFAKACRASEQNCNGR